MRTALFVLGLAAAAGCGKGHVDAPVPDSTSAPSVDGGTGDSSAQDAGATPADAGTADGGTRGGGEPGTDAGAWTSLTSWPGMANVGDELAAFDERPVVTIERTGQAGCEKLLPEAPGGSRLLRPDRKVFQWIDDQGDAIVTYRLFPSEGGQEVVPNSTRPLPVSGGFFLVPGDCISVGGSCAGYDVHRIDGRGNLLFRLNSPTSLAIAGPSGELLDTGSWGEGKVRRWTPDGSAMSEFVVSGAASEWLKIIGADAQGRILVRIGQSLLRYVWYDPSGKQLADVQIDPHTDRFFPLIEGGFAVGQTREDGRTWAGILRGGAASLEVPPAALAEVPDGTLQALSDGRGYALYRGVRPDLFPDLRFEWRTQECSQRVVVLTPDFHSCGAIAFTSSTGACATLPVEVGADGSVLRQSPAELCQRSSYFDLDPVCTTGTARVWDRLLSAQPARGDQNAASAPADLLKYDEGPPGISVEVNPSSGCAELLPAQIPEAVLTSGHESDGCDPAPAGSTVFGSDGSRLELTITKSDVQSSEWIDHCWARRFDPQGRALGAAVEVGTAWRCFYCHGETLEPFLAAVDDSGDALVVQGNRARWLDQRGAIASEWFDSGLYMASSEPKALRAIPSGGIVLRGWGGPWGGASAPGWRAFFTAGVTRFQPVPDWLHDVPAGEIWPIAGGAAMAVSTQAGLSVSPCVQEVQVVKPGKGRCGTIRLAAGNSTCMSSSLLIENDGSLVRRSVLEKCNDRACACTKRRWQHLLPP